MPALTLPIWFLSAPERETNQVEMKNGISKSTFHQKVESPQFIYWLVTVYLKCGDGIGQKLSHVGYQFPAPTLPPTWQTHVSYSE